MNRKLEEYKLRRKFQKMLKESFLNSVDDNDVVAIYLKAHYTLQNKYGIEVLRKEN